MAVEGVGTSTSTADSASALQNAGLAQEDFLKILLAQLQFQDPLKPMDNQEFIAQMAQFSSLELSRQATEKSDTLLAFQSVNQAIGLIGKTVEVSTEGGTSAVGQVTTVTFNNGTPLLTINSTPPLTGVSLSQVTLIR
jgi:flagellar basal-body rod modification protein FlgD